MSMGSKQQGDQVGLFVTYKDVPRSGGHPFYEALGAILRDNSFDRFVEQMCEPFYAESGRPSLAPGIYFRCLLIGYFEGIDSERGIAWRVADSLSLRDFLGLGMTKAPPDHSTLSRTRRRLDVEVHHRVFTWVLTLLARVGLVKGKTIGVDGTTLEANAALRSLVRREDGQSYQDFLIELAKAEGIEEPTREDIARIDRKRPKKGSNEVWVNPFEPDAQISKMKDGATDMAHKAEHAVDLETGAVVAVTLHGGATHDTKSLGATLEAASNNLSDVLENLEAESDTRDGQDQPEHAVSEQIEEVVADKGYHSNRTLCDLDEAGVRSYIAEPDRGRRNWKGKQTEKRVVKGNRRRTKGKRGRRLMRKRGELLERPFAHAYETGGMRRTFLRKHDNILKRLVVHIAGLNLGLLMRSLFGIGTPRSLQGRLAAFLVRFATLLLAILQRLWANSSPFRPVEQLDDDRRADLHAGRSMAPFLGRAFTTGC